MQLGSVWEAVVIFVCAHFVTTTTWRGGGIGWPSTVRCTGAGAGGRTCAGFGERVGPVEETANKSETTAANSSENDPNQSGTLAAKAWAAG